MMEVLKAVCLLLLALVDLVICVSWGIRFYRFSRNPAAGSHDAVLLIVYTIIVCYTLLANRIEKGGGR